MPSLRIGSALWHRSSGRRYTYAGPAGVGLYFVSCPGRGVRKVGKRWLSRGNRTSERREVRGAT